MLENDHTKTLRIKNLLTEKFSKKYNIPDDHYYLNFVIDKFVKDGQISTENLKILDSLLKQELAKVDSMKKRRTLSLGNMECKLPKLDNDNMSVRSKMSGVSKLSQYDFRRKPKEDFDKDYFNIDNISVSSNSRRGVPLSRTSNDSEDDWVAIIKQNNLKFREDKEKDKEKDKLMKQRTKNDLDFQIIDRYNKIETEKKLDKDYADVTLKHTQMLNELEHQKALATKEKYMQEKDKRDKQLRDNKIQKKKEKILEQRKDQAMVQACLRENERVKQIALDKKIKEKEALQKIMKDNEKYKEIQREHHEKIVQEDKKFVDEYKRILEQQDQERVDYVKARQRKANSIDPSVIERKKQELQKKNQEEEKILDKYKEEIEKKALVEDELKKIQEREAKLLMKRALQDQVEEKKQKVELEKHINDEQARIWKQDFDYFKTSKQEEHDKIKIIARENQEFLLKQMEEKKYSKKKKTKMSDEEYKMNRNFLKSTK